MANQYDSVTITGYNATPPSDDGAQTDNNEVTWDKHKTKLGDPVKTGVEQVNTNIEAAFDKTLLAGVSEISTTSTLVETQRGDLIRFTGAGGITFNLLAVSTAGSSWDFAYRNDSSGNVTLDPDGSEQIDGASTKVIEPGESGFVVSNGTAWFTAAALPSNIAFTDQANVFTEDQTISKTGSAATINLLSDLDTGSFAFVEYEAHDDGGNDTVYARTLGNAATNTDGAEVGRWILQTQNAGTLTTQVDVRDGVLIGNPTGGFKGVGVLNAEQLCINNEDVETRLDSIGAVLLGTGVASASASLEFTSLITATYDSYLFVLDSIVKGTGAIERFVMQTSTDNGTTWDSTVDDYTWAFVGFDEDLVPVSEMMHLAGLKATQYH